MKKYNYNQLKRSCAFMLVISCLYGCSGHEKPKSRNKMPEFNSYEHAFESGNYSTTAMSSLKDNGQAFATSVVELETADGMQDFMDIPLPDASLDSIAISLGNVLKPLAIPVLNGWAEEHPNSGIMLDLSRHNGEATYQTSYTLHQTAGFTIPVVIVWDHASAYRAYTATKLVSGIPFISLNQVSGFNPAEYQKY